MNTPHILKYAFVHTSAKASESFALYLHFSIEYNTYFRSVKWLMKPIVKIQQRLKGKYTPKLQQLWHYCNHPAFCVSKSRVPLHLTDAPQRTKRSLRHRQGVLNSQPLYLATKSLYFNPPWRQKEPSGNAKHSWVFLKHVQVWNDQYSESKIWHRPYKTHAPQSNITVSTCWVQPLAGKVWHSGYSEVTHYYFSLSHAN